MSAGRTGTLAHCAGIALARRPGRLGSAGGCCCQIRAGAEYGLEVGCGALVTEVITWLDAGQPGSERIADTLREIQRGVIRAIRH